MKFKHEDKEIEGKAFLNPQYKTLNLYDSNMTRINTNKPLEGMGTITLMTKVMSESRIDPEVFNRIII